MGNERRTTDDYIDAALRLFDKWGAADETLGITVSAAATLAGLGRSSIYRHWETAAELNADAARYAAYTRDTWQWRLLDQPPEGSVADAVTSSIGGLDDLCGNAVRVGVDAWSRSSPARRDIEAWQAVWLDHLVVWCRRHIDAHGLQPAEGLDVRRLAVALASVVEGSITMATWLAVPDLQVWDHEQRQRLGANAERLMAEMTEPVDGRLPRSPADVESLPPLWRAEFSPARSAILEQAVSKSFERVRAADEPVLVTSRVVDMARLARHLDVTERRLYSVWPTTGAFNAEFVRAALARFRSDFETAGAEAVTDALAREEAESAHILIPAFQSGMDAAVDRSPSSLFGLAFAMADEEMQQTVQELVADWKLAQRLLFMAMLAVTGWYIRPEVTADDFTDRVFDFVAGQLHFAVMNPGLVQETSTFRGQEVGLAGLHFYYLVRSMAQQDRPVPPSSIPRSPDLAP